MDAKAVFDTLRDIINIFPCNLKEPLSINAAILEGVFSEYDSIHSKSLYYLPYTLEKTRSIVHSNFEAK